MADAVQELKLVLSLDTRAYQAGLKGAKASLGGLTSAQVAFGVAAAQYAVRGIDAIVKQYKEYDSVLDKLSLQVTNYAKASRAAIQANTATTASLRTVGDAVAIYSSRLEMSAGELGRLTALTAQYAADTGDNATAAAESIAALSNRWTKDAGGIASALAEAGRMSGQTISAIGQQVVDATPYAKALGMSFEQLAAQAVEFKKAGVDFGQYISLMEKNFDKFGGNVEEAKREIQLITNTVRGFKTQSEAVGFLMEQGLSSRAAMELAEALRSYTSPELDKTADAIKGVSDNMDDMEEKVKANLNLFDRLGLIAKTVWDVLLHPTSIPAFTDKELMDALGTAGYSKDESKKILDNLDVYDKLMEDSKMRPKLAPGKIMDFDFKKYQTAPEKGGFLPGQGAFQVAAGGVATDYGGSNISQIVNDMNRVGDIGELVAKNISGNFRAGFSDAANYADNASAVIKTETTTAMEGAAAGAEDLADNSANAAEQAYGLANAGEQNATAWEKAESWINKAVERLGIDPEILTNNIFTGLLRVGKESLESLGMDVDGLGVQIQDFFAKAKGYGFDIQKFWEWAQKGTGQTTTQIWQEALDNMGKATGQFVMQASAMFASGTMDWKALFGGLFRGILASALTAIGKMVAEWLAGLAIVAQAKALLETVPGLGAAIAIGALAVGAIAMLAQAKNNMPAMAEGGLVTGPTHALIGEAGPEAVFPLEKLKDLGIPYGKGGASAAGNGTPVVNITVNNPVLNNRTTESDVRAFMDKMARQVVRKGGSFAGAYS